LTRAAALLHSFCNPQQKGSLYRLDQSNAQILINLMHRITYLTDLDPVMLEAIKEALAKMSGKHKCYPSCLILRGVESENWVDGGSFGDIWMGKIGSRMVAIKVMRAFRDDVQRLLKVFSPPIYALRMSNPDRFFLGKRFCGKGYVIQMSYHSMECAVGKMTLHGFV
jgi:hypothetical protein